MESKKTTKLSALLLGLFFSLPALALDGDAAAGKAGSAICMACHQADGNGMNIPGGESWPRLAGLDANYIYKQLIEFKSGKRVNASMAPFAMMLDDKQMKDLAVYYSKQPAGKTAGTETNAELLAYGKKLVVEGDWDRYIVPCGTCHGPGNKGAGEHFPGIAGQHSGYIESQLVAWQEGKRDNDPQHLMLAIAERMNDRDIKAVAAWLSTQPAQ